MGFVKPKRFFLALLVLLSFPTLKAVSKDHSSSANGSADLSGQPNGSSDPSSSASNENGNLKQWFDRIDISGFINVGYVRTGADGTEPNGHFYAGERLFGANLFIDAKIDEGISARNELVFYNQAVTLKSMYVQFKDAFNSRGLASFKIGRFDLPYGDEYLWQNAPDNPMVLRTAGWPWGVSQGVLLFGHLDALGWVASVTDGLAAPNLDYDDNKGKSLNLKLDLDPADWLHLSASGMEGGTHAQSNLNFGEILITPVGSAVSRSVLGVSPSSMVDFQACQGDVRVRIGQEVQMRGDLGTVFINDVDPYARQLIYYYGEAKVNITPELYVVGRYSAIGTFDSGKGYLLGGDYDGAQAFGYDTKSLTRFGGAVGYWISPNTVLKVEFDNDAIALIDPAVGVDPDPGNDRYTLASEMVVKF